MQRPSSSRLIPEAMPASSKRRQRQIISSLACIAPQRLLRAPGGSGLPAAFARAAAAEGGATDDLGTWFQGIVKLLDSLDNELFQRLQAGQHVQPVAAAMEVARVPGFWQAVMWGLGDKHVQVHAAATVVKALNCTNPVVCGTAGLPVIDNLLATPGLLTALLTIIGGPGIIATSSTGSSRGRAAGSCSGGSGSGGGSGGRSSGGVDSSGRNDR